MKNYYMKVVIETEIEVCDCENVEEAIRFLENQIEDFNLPDFYEIEIKEV